MASDTPTPVLPPVTPPAAPPMQPQIGSVPNPDPTARTIEQLKSEIAASREIAEAKLSGVRETLETRLTGMDKAIELLQTSSNKIPAMVKDEVAQLKDLHDERFNSFDSQLRAVNAGIQTQFVERDKRTEQLSIADKTAIAAALQAQKEAAGATNESNGTALIKMENNFTKLIEQGQTLLAAVVRNTDEKINDLKSRLDRGEGKSSVSDPAFALLLAEVKSMRTDATQQKGKSEGVSIALAGVLSVITLIVAIGGSAMVSSLIKGSSPPAREVVYVPAPAPQVK